MDPIVYAKQKAISVQFLKITDDIAKRFGLETRLIKLNIESLSNPECEIVVYTPHGHRIGTIDVRLNVADCKAKVTCALFRDLEDAVDDWTFDVAGDSCRKDLITPELIRQAEELDRQRGKHRMRCTNAECQTGEWDGDGHMTELCPGCAKPSTPVEPGVAVQDETASAESFVPVAMECRNESCSETVWVAIRPEATKCFLCGIESTIVQRFTCLNTTCSVDFWNPRRYPEYRRTCPECKIEGVAIATVKKGDDSRPWKGKMFCTNPACGFTEWEGDEHGGALCPMCGVRGQSVETLGFTEKSDIEKRKPK